MEGVHPLFYLYLAAGNFHFHKCESSAAYRRLAAPIATLLLYGLGAAAVFIFILITPYSGYQLWFELLKSGAQRGIISLTFLLTVGFLCLVAAGGVREKRRLVPVLLGLHLVLLVAFVITRQAPVFLASIALFLAARGAPPAEGRRLFGALRGRLSMAALALTAAAAALAFSTGKTAGGVELFDTVVSQAIRRGVLDVFPEFPVLYGIPGFGYHYAADNFADRPVLSERPLFYVTAPSGSSLYLRSLVYDTYASNGWRRLRTPAGDGPLRDPAVYDDTGLDRPAAADESRIEIELSSDFYPYYLHTLKTSSLVLRQPAVPAGQAAQRKPPPLIRGSKNTALEPERPLIVGDRFVVVEKDMAVAAAPAIPASVDERRPGSNLRQVFANRISGLYGGLPPNVAQALRAFSGRFAGRDPRQIPAIIRDILHNGYEYTLNPPAHDSARDFVANFLFTTRAGYCVHFASAAAVLARMAGIPARYVSGFLVNIPYDEYMDYDPVAIGTGYGSSLTVPVTGLTAHAWVELWFPETGWVVFEATPPMEPQAYADPDFWQRYLMPGGLTARQLNAIAGGRAQLQDGPQNAFGLDLAALLPAAGGLAALGGLAAGIAYALTHKRKKRVREHGFESVKALGRRAVRRARRRGIPLPDSIGWMDWERRVKLSLRRGDCDLVDGRLGLFREAFFAGRRPGIEELKELRRLVGRLG